MDFLFALLLFVIITVLAAVLFIGWIVWVIVRAIVRAGSAVLEGTFKDQPMVRPQPHRVCTFARCRAANPIEARYCRRCGRALEQVQQVTARRVAVV